MEKNKPIKLAVFAVCVAAATLFVLTRCDGAKERQGAAVEATATATGQSDKSYCEWLKSSGAADAYIEPGERILYIGFTSGAVTGTPDDVARLWFEDAAASGVAVSECRIMELPKGKMIGRYKPRKP